MEELAESGAWTDTAWCEHFEFFEASYCKADLIGFTKINILNWLRVNLCEGKHLLHALSTQNKMDPTYKILFDYTTDYCRKTSNSLSNTTKKSWVDNA